ncbi:hypothetical protein AMAG_01494 [Allomyces macrogynus ATCC 38327]|uniref:Fe2OG dioxygenase domain-containing protein n=1 Tax=Allomyces macrogynus (strain ATCC 38327) TaxID=578462 RepID=A0A0L0RZW1_ALLM3|nr:hypothetical protein AMAG_01494 [Allomyces macrogynus ATCC 38327]|eukprot:KNE55604.1 hypothetical protein AMAG_01494 [Allomyces macrogynus ATCC 38327]
MDRDEYRELFGDDDDDDDNSDNDDLFDNGGSRDNIPAAPSSDALVLRDPSVPGLALLPHFISPTDQARVSFGLHEHVGGSLTAGVRNQSMHFGLPLPPWIADIAASIHAHFQSLDPPRDPAHLFDQLIMNGYAPGDGIVPHVDLVRFADGVAVLSLDAPLVMDVTRVPPGDQQAERAYAGERLGPVDSVELFGTKTDDVPPVATDDEIAELVAAGPWTHWVTHDWARVLLVPGSLLVLEGDARWRWAHGIRFATEDWWPMLSGEWRLVPRRPRSSITFRKLIPDE